MSARHLQHLLTHAAAMGADVDALLAEAGLVRARLEDPDYQVPLPAFDLVLLRFMRDPAHALFGLRLAGDVQPALLGPVGYIAQACSSLSDLIDVVPRYAGVLLSNVARASVVRARGVVEVQWQPLVGSRIFRREIADYVLGTFVVMGRLLLPGRKDLPIAVNLAHARPASPAQVREYISFFRCPVYFDRPVNSIVSPAATMTAKLPHGDAFVKNLLERHAASLIRQQSAAPSLLDDVKHLLAAMILEGVPTKDKVAAQLGMSSRNLQRKLQEMGLSYRLVLDEVRLAAAKERLAATASAGEISDSLGFSTRQAFLRWFKQRTGKTPSGYRSAQAL